MDMDYLSRIERRLDMPPVKRAEVMRELRAHYEELRDELVASGMGAEEAQCEAERRLGRPSEIASRLSAAHNVASWRSALLCVVPFGLSAIYLITSALRVPQGVARASLVAVLLAMLAISVRELVRGRRPVWLATWLAAGLGVVSTALSGLGDRSDVAGLRETAAALAVLAVVVTVLGIRTKRWTVAALTTSGVAVLCSSYVLLGPEDPNKLWFLPLLIVLAVAPAMLLLLAWFLFEAHPRSSAAHASLFVLALFALKFAPSDRVSVDWIQALAAIASGLCVVWFVRIPVRRDKLVASFFALLASCFPAASIQFQNLGITVYDILAGTVSALFSTGVCYLFVSWPIRRETAERDRLRLAQ